MLDAEDGQEQWTRSQVAQDRIVAQALQVGSRVFVGTADNLLIAMDVDDDGQPLWGGQCEELSFSERLLGVLGFGPDRDCGFETEHSIWGQSAYEDGVLFVPSLDKRVYALDAETGIEKWRADVGGSVSDKPILNGDLVYVGSFDKQLHALDKATGESRWTAPATGSVWGAPTINDGTVYFVDLNGNAFAVDAETGEQFWQYTTGDYVVAAPVVHDGVVYVATGGDPELKLSERSGALVALEAESGEELWRITDLTPVYTTPAIVGDAIVLAMQSEEQPLTVLTVDTNDHNRTSTLFPEVPTAE